MKAELINKLGVSYIKLSLDVIRQKGECFYVGKMNAADLFKVYTVEPAEYDLEKLRSEADSVVDDREYFDKVLKDKQTQVSEKKFQRHADKGKLAEVKEYLDSKRYAFFPNSIIVTCETSSKSFDSSVLNEYFEFISKDKHSTQSFFAEVDGNGGTEYFLYIPLRKSALLVIDGQHRIRGLEMSDEALKKPYEVLLSFIINYDRSVVAEQFYTINFTPRKVNKSVLLYLMGDFNTGMKEVVYLHEVARVFNEFKDSPLRFRIKMLGKVDAALESDKRRLQTISQAFFIDSLAPSLRFEESASIRQPIFAFFFLQGRDGRVAIQRFLLKYFMAMKKLRQNDWCDPESMICKSVGFGAMVDIMFFYFVLKSCGKYVSMDWVDSISVSGICQDLAGIADVDLNRFKGMSSAGVLGEITSLFVGSSPFFSGHTYKEFLQEYRLTALKEYRAWFRDIVIPLINKENRQTQISLLDD